MNTHKPFEDLSRGRVIGFIELESEAWSKEGNGAEDKFKSLKQGRIFSLGERMDSAKVE